MGAAGADSLQPRGSGKGPPHTPPGLAGLSALQMLAVAWALGIGKELSSLLRSQPRPIWRPTEGVSVPNRGVHTRATTDVGAGGQGTGSRAVSPTQPQPSRQSSGCAPHCGVKGWEGEHVDGLSGACGGPWGAVWAERWAGFGGAAPHVFGRGVEGAPGRCRLRRTPYSGGGRRCDWKCVPCGGEVSRTRVRAPEP